MDGPARELMILTGGCLDPGCAYLIVRGLKTLQLRVERACQRCLYRHALEKHPKVSHVYFPGLPGHADHALAERQMKDFGMMVSFELRGGEAAVDRFIKSLSSGTWRPAWVESSPSCRTPCSPRTSASAPSG